MLASTRFHVCCAPFVLTACLVVAPCARAQTADAATAAAPVEQFPGTLVPAPATQLPVAKPAGRSVFKDLFGGTVSDLRRLPSMDSLRWLGVGAVAAEAAHFADFNVTSTLSRSEELGETLKSGRTVGGATVQLGGSFATYLIGRASGNDRVAAVGGEMFRAQLITQGLTHAIKFSVRRARPDGTSYSFPSGHTSTSFASATVLQREFGWRVGIPAYGLASYVAASRVQSKRHFLSDVAFGAALGVLVGRTVTIGRGDARFAVEPFAASHGGGIGFTWVGPR
jgi:membrane-associated phospholipid phosphatase